MNAKTFSSQHYKVKEILKKASNGQPMTFLIIAENGKSQLVVKQVPFPLFELPSEMQRRLATFSSLEDTGIIPVLGTYKQGQKLYLVREYLDARSLVSNRTFHPEEVEIIAIAILEVLSAIQYQAPSIVHGNIKPENIFFQPNSSQGSKIVLTDFALTLVPQWRSNLHFPELARLGFVPLEQVAGNPTPASDNYAVGAVLLSLLSGTDSHQLYTLTGEENPYHYPVQEILLKQNFPMSSYFMDWLGTMLAPDVGDRFPDARTALYDLLRIQVTARPHVQLSRSSIYLQAARFGDQLQTYIEIRNLMPGTVLQGKWRVTPYLNDSGDWIQFDTDRVFGNESTMLLSIDTEQLLVDKQYVRELVFQSNSERPIIAVSLVVKTGSLKLSVRPLPVLHLTGLLVVSGFLPIALSIILW